MIIMANIIVIDDHPTVLKLLANLCRQMGHDVMAFDNGIGGLEAVRELRPELALVDRRLGDLDGLEIVERVRQECPETRCVMVSALQETRDIVQAVRRGACNYVTKPFSSEEIADAVNQALAEEPEPMKRQVVIVSNVGIPAAA
tara:strand:+ start:382 stop:813 length:432 start_codon:yes stop_codon:yes gene_type:complete